MRYDCAFFQTIGRTSLEDFAAPFPPVLQTQAKMTYEMFLSVNISSTGDDNGSASSSRAVSRSAGRQYQEHLLQKTALAAMHAGTSWLSEYGDVYGYKTFEFPHIKYSGQGQITRIDLSALKLGLKKGSKMLKKVLDAMPNLKCFEIQITAQPPSSLPHSINRRHRDSAIATVDQPITAAALGSPMRSGLSALQLGPSTPPDAVTHHTQNRDSIFVHLPVISSSHAFLLAAIASADDNAYEGPWGGGAAAAAPGRGCWCCHPCSDDPANLLSIAQDLDACEVD
jgi:hypothetical protein